MNVIYKIRCKKDQTITTVVNISTNVGKHF